MTTITPKSIYETLKKENPTSIIFLQTYDNEWSFVICDIVSEFRKYMSDRDFEMGDCVDCSDMYLTITWESGSHYEVIQFFDKDDYRLFTEGGLSKCTKYLSIEDKAAAFEELVEFLTDQYDVVEHIWDGIKDIVENGEEARTGRKLEKEKLELIKLERKKEQKELAKQKRSEEWEQKWEEKRKAREEEWRMAKRPTIKPFEFPDLDKVVSGMVK